MSKDEALKLTLAALKQIDEAMPFPVAKLAIMEAEKALAQPEQEPVAMKFKIYLPVKHQINHANLPWVYDQDRSTGNVASMWVTPVATLPPQRTWVGLTEEEIDQGLLRSDYAFKTAEAWRAGVVFAMTKLKEKNT